MLPTSEGRVSLAGCDALAVVGAVTESAEEDSDVYRGEDTFLGGHTAMGFWTSDIVVDGASDGRGTFVTTARASVFRQCGDTRC